MDVHSANATPNAYRICNKHKIEASFLRTWKIEMLCLKRLHRTSSRDDKQVQTKILLWDFQWIWKLKSSKSRAHEFFKNWDFLWTSFKNGTLRVKTKWQNVHMNIFVSLWLQDTCHMMPFTKQHSAYAWVVTCILFLINLTFHNLPLHSSYKIHQPITDYFLRLPYSELLENGFFALGPTVV